MVSEIKSTFHDTLKKRMDEYVHFIYDITLHFPKEEQFGLTSQIRRAALSIILNYIEGYARQRKNVLKNFLEISYASLKESKYLLYFTYKRKIISEFEYKKGIAYTEEIGKMIWGILKKI